MALLYLRETNEEQFAAAKSHQDKFSRSLLTIEEMGDCILDSYICLPLGFFFPLKMDCPVLVSL